MRKLSVITVLLLLAMMIFPACNSSDNNNNLYDTYAEWRDKNNAWLLEQERLLDSNGQLYYTKIVPVWNPNAYVLIHYLNDRKLTEGNLSPLYTSTVDTRYHLSYYNGTPIDSSYMLAANGPGIFRTTLTSVIEGWAIALQHMRCGDSAEVVIPYQQGYGATLTSSVLPYSALKFQMSLVDIPAYEINPKSL